MLTCEWTLFLRQETTREVRPFRHDTASRSGLSHTQMTRTAPLEVTGPARSWETIRTLPHTASNSKGYSSLLLPLFLILTLWKNQPATQDDVLRLCQSFHHLTRELIKEVVVELQRGGARRSDPTHYMADDESEGDLPRRRLKKPKSRCPGANRRAAEQNALSVYSYSLRFHR